MLSPKTGTHLPAEAAPRRVHRIFCAENGELGGPTLRCALENGGHHVECVTDGKQAWERISVNVKFFDVLITDHRMQHMTGLELVKKLRQTRFTGRIIVHCGHLPAEDFYAYRALAVDYIFRKPVNTAILVNLVAQIG